MEKGCNCTKGGMSTSIAPGKLVLCSQTAYVLMTGDRKGKDYTYLYGSHVGTGSLTPYIAKAFDERVEE